LAAALALVLLVEARGFGFEAAFFLANGFSSSELSSSSSSSSLSLYDGFGFALAFPFVAPFDLRGAGFLADRGISSSESSESGVVGFWTRRFAAGWFRQPHSRYVTHY
jgi:hypothetical protein